MKTKTKIIISIPLVWSVRNFILSGITDQLEQFFEIYYAIPEVGKASMLERGIPNEKLLLLKGRKLSKVQMWCSLIIRYAHRRRFPTKSDDVFKPILKPATGFRGLLLRITSFIFSITFLFRFLEYLECKLFIKKVDVEFKNQLKAIKPAFALSTSYVVDAEWSLFRTLHDLQIKIYTHILSFDNLTSRGYLPIKYFDGFLVWNEKMKDELQHIYAIPSSKITITGTPQFDFHINKRYIKSRAWTCEMLGIDQGHFIVYCANHYALTPDEPQLLEKIIDAFQQDELLSSHQIVLRLHPMDDYDRWNAILKKYPAVRVSYPWVHKDKTHLFWGNPSLDDLILFSNTLRYCNLVINIASTISIDAAILDKPVVCVGFSSNSSNAFNSLYYNFHHSEHYAPIMATGSTPLSVDLNSLVNMATDGIQNPDELSEKRQGMVRLLCGDTDGTASSKIINFISHLKIESNWGNINL